MLQQKNNTNYKFHSIKPIKIAVVTGASSGMGMEFVKQLDKKCMGLDEIWIIARRKDLMNTLAGATKARIRCFPMDLTNESYEMLLQELKARRVQVKVLVNSAGYGKTGPFTHISELDNTGMIDVNCKALAKITYAILPYMTRGSYIINLASAASFLPQPNFTIYAATKSFVLSFSRGLNRELRSRGIWVSAICPGPVDTEFFSISEEEGSPYGLKKLFMANKEKVVSHAIRQSFRKKEVIVYGTSMKMLRLICKILPKGLVLNIYAKSMRGIS